MIASSLNSRFYALANIVFIGNFVNIFDAGIITNDFYIIADYCLPEYVIDMQSTILQYVKEVYMAVF